MEDNMEIIITENPMDKTMENTVAQELYYTYGDFS